MAYGPVGIPPAVVFPAAGSAANPAWGTGQNRVAGNLLVCWVAGSSTTTLPTTPAGWSIAAQVQGTNCSSTVFYKIAAGSDAAPSIAAATSTRWAALLGEFSGGAAGNPLDKTATAVGTNSPLVATAGGADFALGELVIGCSSALYSVGATKTLAHTLNNGAVATESTNNATSTTVHYDLVYGVTTGNSSADSDSFAFTTTNVTGVAVALASFKPATNFLVDTFTGTDATALESHVGETGATWTKYANAGGTGSADIRSNRVRTVTTPMCYYASGVPATADYDVTAVLQFLDATGGKQVWGRCDTTADTAYVLGIVASTGAWTLAKHVAGVSTQLATGTVSLSAGSYTMMLRMRGSTIQAFWQGSQVASVTDTDITAAGKIAIHNGGGTEGTATGFHLDSLTGANQFTYTDSQSGSLTLTGSSTDSKSVADTPAGTLAPTGSTTDLKRVADSSTGPLILSGTLSETKRYTDTATGTFALAGTSTDAKRYTDSSTASLALSGSLVESAQRADTVAGIFTLTGSNTDSRTYTDQNSGSLILTGSIAEQYDVPFTDSPSGSLTLGGSIADSQTRTSTLPGALVLSGPLVEQYTHTSATSGALVLAGSLGEEFKIVPTWHEHTGNPWPAHSTSQWPEDDGLGWAAGTAGHWPESVGDQWT